MRPNLNCSYRNIREWSYFNISIILLLPGCKPELIHELQFHVFLYLYINSLRDAYFYKLTNWWSEKGVASSRLWEPVIGWRGCGLNRVLFVTYLEYQKTKQHWRKERWRSKELRVDFLHVPHKNKKSYYNAVCTTPETTYKQVFLLCGNFYFCQKIYKVARRIKEIPVLGLIITFVH